MIHFVDQTLPSLEENLALDEALLLAAEGGGVEALRTWEWPGYAVVLGAGGCIDDDVHVARCQADGVPILRRSSGGGTVLLGPGCLLFSLVLAYARAPELADLRTSYAYILKRVSRAVNLAQAASLQGSSDLAVGQRKFSGNSQQRKRTHLLHHGTLLYAFDFTQVERYLKIPPRQPEYRAGRTHADFLMNLKCDAPTLVRSLCDSWQACATRAALPKAQVQSLVDQKYRTREWTWRR